MNSLYKPHACQMCNKTFTRKYTLRRHMENIHAEEQSTADSEDTGHNYQDEHEHYEPYYKKRRVVEYHNQQAGDEEEGEESSKDSESESEREEEDDVKSDRSREEGEEEEVESVSSDLEDNAAYQDWLEEAKETTEGMWNTKYQKYLNEGMSEDEAKEKADMKTRWAVKRNFFARFKDFLCSHLHLKDDDTYQEITWDLAEKIEKGFDINTALNRVVPKYKSKFAGLFAQDEENDDEEDNEEEEEQ